MLAGLLALPLLPCRSAMAAERPVAEDHRRRDRQGGVDREISKA
jgi:hypothetical protein